ncbi:tyrosine-type recombinase/integrase [uncultured Clostridium sp.]|uniref:tyrosine-type recombinase/integrase n=1 Tax=uncultured Clostridium sp. TaxID=59620 RepID=UPI002635907B|nr:tyrosine-type recombinase/integrase [uncultured Clostridium sp.]
MGRQKSRSIKQQLYHTINENFKEAMDKHNLKKDGKMDGTRIFSYADRKNLVDFTANFANWMYVEHKEIRLVKDINSKHVQEFLDFKGKTCSKATVEQYMSKANKMQRLINKTYNLNNKLEIKLPEKIKHKQKIRDKQMEIKDWESLKKIVNPNADKALDVARYFGLRVSAVVKLQKRDINLKEGYVKVVDSKGKKTRKVDIVTEKQMEIAKKLFNSVTGAEQRIVPIQAGSVNAEIRRKMEQLEIKQDYKKTSTHAVRKLYAQETFNRVREEGMTIMEAREYTSDQLGHTEERGDTDDKLMKTYVRSLR